MSITKSANIFLYGKGVFTTVPFYCSEPFLWEKHWRRLTDNAAKLGIDISGHSGQSILELISTVIGENGSANGRVRVAFVDESSGELWGGGEKKTAVSIIAGGPRCIPQEFRVGISPYRVNTTSPLAGIKTCNYLEPLMALDEAKARGFDEAIRLNERGEVASACTANVFWLEGRRLYTPSLKTGCLAGTTREYVLENFDCEEFEAGIDAIQQADEIFLTSAGIGVVQVSGFDGRKLRHNDHPITGILPF